MSELGNQQGDPSQRSEAPPEPSDFGSNVVRYEWDGEEGDIGPRSEELENALFGKPEDRISFGIDYSMVEKIDVVQEGAINIKPIASFDKAGFHPAMLENVKMAGLKFPTPIQKYCIPAIGMGHDVIAIAQTGSGKTGAYMIPILNQLMGKAKKLAAPRPSPQEFAAGTAVPVRAEPLVVVICPARELAIQIFDQARKLCYRTMLRPCVVYGGGQIGGQIQQIMRGCDVLIATPGRLVDFMERADVLTMARVKYMVVDEADEMLQGDWEDQFTKILSGSDQADSFQLSLFSATFPRAMRQIAREYLSDDHFRVRVGRIGSTHSNIVQEVVWVDAAQKQTALFDLLCDTVGIRTIIFANSKRTVDQLDDLLFHKDVPATSMHSDRSQLEREDAMRAFRAGRKPILITTGVSARGIDVKYVGHVINFDLPSVDHDGIQGYTHRIGRTGRMGATGRATSFYNERDDPIAPELTKKLMETGQNIPDFLERYKPEDGTELNFDEDNTDNEDELEAGADGNGGTSGEAWGTSGDTNGNNNAGAWGASGNANGNNADW